MQHQLAAQQEMFQQQLAMQQELFYQHAAAQQDNFQRQMVAQTAAMNHLAHTMETMMTTMVQMVASLSPLLQGLANIQAPQGVPIQQLSMHSLPSQPLPAIVMHAGSTMAPDTTPASISIVPLAPILSAGSPTVGLPHHPPPPAAPPMSGGPAPTMAQPIEYSSINDMVSGTAEIDPSRVVLSQVPAGETH